MQKLKNNVSKSLKFNIKKKVHSFMLIMQYFAVIYVYD